MTEKALERKAIDYLKSRGAYVRKQSGTPLSGKGVPDRFVCYRGRFIALEFKHPDLNLSKELLAVNDVYAEPAQRKHLQEIRAAGGLAFVVNSLEHIDEVLGLV